VSQTLTLLSVPAVADVADARCRMVADPHLKPVAAYIITFFVWPLSNTLLCRKCFLIPLCNYDPFFCASFMNHSPQASDVHASTNDPAQHEFQAALHIFNGISPGKDHLSKVANCFECSSIPKSTFIAEEGCQVCSTFAYSLACCFDCSFLLLLLGNQCICYIWRTQHLQSKPFF
jgi:hypothetical protein